MYLLSRAGIVYFAFFFGTLDCYCQPRGKLRVVNVEPRSCEQLRRGLWTPIQRFKAADKRQQVVTMKTSSQHRKNGGMLIGAASFAIQEALRRPLFNIFGEDDCGGTPRWRSALVLFPQVISMGSTCAYAAHSVGWSMQRWADDCAMNGLSAAARGSIYCFYAYLLSDLLYWWFMPPPPLMMRDLMVIHHVVCILGTIYATDFCPRVALPSFVVSIVCLEFGSAFSNAYHLFRDSPGIVEYFKPTYFVGMCCSNAACCVWLYQWHIRSRSAGLSTIRRWVPILITLVLVGMRQETVHRLARADPLRDLR